MGELVTGSRKLVASGCRRPWFPGPKIGIIHPMDVDLPMGTPGRGAPLAVVSLRVEADRCRHQ